MKLRVQHVGQTVPAGSISLLFAPLAVFLFIGCRSTVEFIPGADGKYTIRAPGEVAASIERDGTKAMIDTRRPSILRSAIERVAEQGGVKTR